MAGIMSGARSFRQSGDSVDESSDKIKRTPSNRWQEVFSFKNLALSPAAAPKADPYDV